MVDNLKVTNFKAIGALSGSEDDLQSGIETLTGPGAVSVEKWVTKLVTTGADALTLADGQEGMLKTVVMETFGGNGVLTPDNLAGATSITFNSVGDAVVLQFVGGSWYILGSNGVLIA